MKEDLEEEKVTLNGVKTTKEEVENLKESTSSDKNTTVVETGKNQFATRLND